MSKKIEDIYNELNKEKINFHEDIDRFNKKYSNLSVNEKLELVSLLSEKDIFRWILLISNITSNIASVITQSNNTYIYIIESIINKLKNDFAQGFFINALVNIGKENPLIAKDIIKKLSDDEKRVYAGFILGGIGKSNFTEILNYDKGADTLNKKIILLTALSTALKDEKEIKNNREFILKTINKYSHSDEDENIKISAMLLNFNLYKFFKDECYKNLLNLCSDKTSDNILYRMAEYLWINGLDSDVSREFELIKLCALSENKNVLDRVMLFLSQKNKYNTEVSFGIIKDLIEKNLDTQISSFDFALKEIGRNNIDGIEKELLKYLKNKKLSSYEITKFSFAINKIYEENEKRYFKIIKNLESSDEEDKKILGKFLEHKIRFNEMDLIFDLSKEVDKWGQYPSNVAVFEGKKSELIDFILDTKVGEIVVEVKIFKKEIDTEIAKSLRNQLIHLMKLANTKRCLLILLCPKLLKQTRDVLEESKDIKIDIIQNQNYNNIIKLFRDYLNKLEPNTIK
jgi:hypothetical protein